MSRLTVHCSYRAWELFVEISKNVVVVISRELCGVTQTTFCARNVQRDPSLAAFAMRSAPWRLHDGVVPRCFGPDEGGSLRRSECGTH